MDDLTVRGATRPFPKRRESVSSVFSGTDMYS